MTWEEAYPACALVADLHEKGKSREEIMRILKNDKKLTKLQVAGLTHNDARFVDREAAKKRVQRAIKKETSEDK